jgi:hypothetical protein
MKIQKMQEMISSLPELEGLLSLLQNNIKHMTKEFTIEGMQLSASTVKHDTISTSNISDTTFETAVNYSKEHIRCLKDINDLTKKINDIKALLSTLLPCERFIVDRHIIGKVKQRVVKEEYLEKFGKELGLSVDRLTGKYMLDDSSFIRFKQKILHNLVRTYENAT